MNEEKVLYDWELKVCKALLPLFHHLYSGHGHLTRPHRVGHDPKLPHVWRLTDTNDSRRRTLVTFKGIGYIDGDRVFGTPSVFSIPSTDQNNLRETLHGGPEGFDQDISRSITSLIKEYSDYSQSVNFSVTNTTKAEVKGGVSGIGEASLSTELTITAGAAFGQTGGKGRENTVTREVSTHAVVPANESRVLTIDFKRTKEVTPYTETGYIDSEIEIDAYDWAGKCTRFLTTRREASNKIHCANWRDLILFLEGERVVSFPGMRNFIHSISDNKHNKQRSAYHWLKNKRNRLVSLEGQRTLEYDSDAETRIRKA